MPKMDKDEALVKVRKLLGRATTRPMTILKKEISNLNVGALIQFHDFLVEEVVEELSDGTVVQKS